MDGFSPDFFLYWNLILSHLCTGYHGRRLRIPLNITITLFLDINVPCCFIFILEPAYSQAQAPAALCAGRSLPSNQFYS